MGDAWLGGSIGTITERDVADALTERLGLSERQRGEFLADLWREYLGTGNAELIDYVRRLRPPRHSGHRGACHPHDAHQLGVARDEKPGTVRPVRLGGIRLACSSVSAT